MISIENNTLDPLTQEIMKKDKKSAHTGCSCYSRSPGIMHCIMIVMSRKQCLQSKLDVFY